MICKIKPHIPAKCLHFLYLQKHCGMKQRAAVLVPLLFLSKYFDNFKFTLQIPPSTLPSLSGGCWKCLASRWNLWLCLGPCSAMLYCLEYKEESSGSCQLSNWFYNSRRWNKLFPSFLNKQEDCREWNIVIPETLTERLWWQPQKFPSREGNMVYKSVNTNKEAACVKE